MYIMGETRLDYMAQQLPEENSKLKQLLRLADQLSFEDQELLVEQIKLKWLRRAIDEADESLAEGDSLSLDQLDEHIASSRQRIVKEGGSE